jgi:hypothetical protein
MRLGLHLEHPAVARQLDLDEHRIGGNVRPAPGYPDWLSADQPTEEATMSTQAETGKDDEEHPAPPHDEDADEPLGAMTPDDESPLGDTPEAHDEISPHDLPPDHPGRQEAERRAPGPGDTTHGDS